jgi:hypothetical protein
VAKTAITCKIFPHYPLGDVGENAMLEIDFFFNLLMCGKITTLPFG